MAYVKKISDTQFVLDCINKQYEIIKSDIHFNTWEELIAYAKEHPKWYSDSEYTNLAQYLEWRRYFLEHFYDWQPKRVKLAIAEREFSWFNLQYGLKYGFDINEVYAYDEEHSKKRGRKSPKKMD